MKFDHQKVKRLLIYLFYDKGGVVDHYVLHTLKCAREANIEIYSVCGGKLTPEGRDSLKENSDYLMCCESGENLFLALKSVIAYGELQILTQYDEVICMSNELMGPVYSFPEVLMSMEEKDVDFWGIDRVFDRKESSLRPLFFALRSSVLQSEFFKELVCDTKAEDHHVKQLLCQLAKAGFIWDSFVRMDDMESLAPEPLLYIPLTMVRDHHCPFFPRGIFSQSRTEVYSLSEHSQTRGLLDYLSQKQLYDVDLIWETILRTFYMADIKNALDLNYILPSDRVINSDHVGVKVALIMHIYYEDLIGYCYRYALSMPPESDIIVTSTSEEKCRAIERHFQNGPWHSVKVIPIENRGRDVSSLLVGAAPYLKEYDYVCFVHDKKVPQLDLSIKGESFSNRCFENLLSSGSYVNNIIEMFAQNPRLGILMPPIPNFAEYYSTLGCEWGKSLEISREYYEKLYMKSPFSEEKEPITPLGTMFWFRPAALSVLLDYEWKYSDFPEEPNKTDGTVLHAVERLYSFSAQDAGYYCAWVLTERYAQSEWAKMFYYLREVSTRTACAYGENSFSELISKVDSFQECADGKGNIAVLWNMLKKNIETKFGIQRQ